MFTLGKDRKRFGSQPLRVDGEADQVVVARPLRTHGIAAVFQRRAQLAGRIRRLWVGGFVEERYALRRCRSSGEAAKDYDDQQYLFHVQENTVCGDTRAAPYRIRITT